MKIKNILGVSIIPFVSIAPVAACLCTSCANNNSGIVANSDTKVTLTNGILNTMFSFKYVASDKENIEKNNIGVEAEITSDAKNLYVDNTTTMTNDFTFNVPCQISGDIPDANLTLKFNLKFTFYNNYTSKNFTLNFNGLEINYIKPIETGNIVLDDNTNKEISSSSTETVKCANFQFKLNNVQDMPISFTAWLVPTKYDANIRLWGGSESVRDQMTVTRKSSAEDNTFDVTVKFNNEEDLQIGATQQIYQLKFVFPDHRTYFVNQTISITWVA